MLVYRPPNQNREYLLYEWEKIIDYFLESHDNHVIIDVFNLDSMNGLLKKFRNNSVLYNRIKMDTCFKYKGTCIDFILTNRKYSLSLKRLGEVNLTPLWFFQKCVVQRKGYFVLFCDF